MREALVVTVGTLCILLLLACPTKADDLILEAGVNQSIYGDEASPELSYVFRGGWKDVYLWGTKEDVKVKMLGQPLGEADILSFGLGARQSFGKMTVFAEAGWGINDTSVNADIQQEIVYTQLVGNHHVHGRPLPVHAKGKKGYESSYEAEDGPVWRVGVAYDIIPHVRLSLSYKGMKVDTEYAIWDHDQRKNGFGYWREDSTHDFSAFEAGLVAHW